MKEGDKFPKGVEFLYIPIDPSVPQDALSCSRPIKLSLDKLTGNLLIISIPAAFSPICTEQHLPDILTNLDKLDQLNIENVVIYSVNDAFALNAWGKLLANKYKFTRKVYFASDPNAEFTSRNQLGADKSKFGMGYRSGRFATIVSDGIVKYLKSDEAGVENSGIGGILKAKL